MKNQYKTNRVESLFLFLKDYALRRKRNRGILQDSEVRRIAASKRIVMNAFTEEIKHMQYLLTRVPPFKARMRRVTLRRYVTSLRTYVAAVSYFGAKRQETTLLKTFSILHGYAEMRKMRRRRSEESRRLNRAWMIRKVLRALVEYKEKRKQKVIDEMLLQPYMEIAAQAERQFAFKRFLRGIERAKGRHMLQAHLASKGARYFEDRAKLRGFKMLKQTAE